MRKTKPPRRSRIIRKWDGTPVDPALDTAGNPAGLETSGANTDATSRASEQAPLTFEIDHEDQLTDTLDR